MELIPHYCANYFSCDWYCQYIISEANTLCILCGYESHQYAQYNKDALITFFLFTKRYRYSMFTIEKEILLLDTSYVLVI